MTTASFTIKVVYNHTRIASYRHWGARSAGQLRVWLLVLDGRSAKLAGGLPSGPILSGLSGTPTFLEKWTNGSSSKRMGNLSATFEKAESAYSISVPTTRIYRKKCVNGSENSKGHKKYKTRPKIGHSFKAKKQLVK